MYRPVPLCDISQVVRTGTYYIIVQVGTGRYVPVRTDMYQVYRIPDGGLPVPPRDNSFFLQDFKDSTIVYEKWNTENDIISPVKLK